MAGPLRNTTMRVNIEVNSRPLDDANRRINETAQSTDRLDRSARRSGESLNNQSRNADNASRSLRGTSSVVERLNGALKAIGVSYFANKVLDIGKAAISTGMEFGKQMSAVQAISGATGDQFKAMRDQAISLGSSTVKSASEVSQGQLEMAKSGFTVNQTMAAMPGLISASTASGEDMARTTEVMTAALNSFQLKASAAGHVSDVLAQAANDSAADINDLGYAFKYAAAPAHALGMSLEEVSAATEVMANAGIKGDTAGTSLRSALLRLANPPKEASAQLKKLGVSITDAHGKMFPFSNIIGQLNTKTKGMANAQKTAALSAIFGTDAVSGMLAVVDAGPKKLDKLTASLKNSDGASAKAAKTMQDNFAGAMEQLKGTIESISINVSDVLTPTIRSAASWLSDMGQKFNDLSPTGKKIAVWGSIVVAGIVPTIYVIKKTTETVGWLKDALTGSHDSFSNFRREMDETSVSASRMASSVQAANEAAGEVPESASMPSVGSRAERNQSSRGGFFSRFRRGASSVAQEAETTTESLPTRAEYRSASRLSRLTSIGSKFAKGAGYLSVGLNAIDLIRSTKDSIVENIGGMTGSGAGMAIGSAIGTAIAPGIGTAIGGAVGSWAGSFLGSTIGASIQKHHPEIVKKVSGAIGSVKAFFKDPLNTKVDFGKSVSKSASKAINSYVELASKSKEQLSLLAINGDKYSKSARDAVNRNFSSMPALVEKSLSKTQKSTQKDLSTLVKNGLMSDKDAKAIEKKQAASQKAKLKAVEDSSKKMIQINNDGYKKEQAITSKAEVQINAIKSKAAKQGRTLTQSEQNQIKKIESKAANDRKKVAQQTQSAISKEEAKQRKNVVASLSKSAKQQKLILGKLKDDSGNISAKQAADIVKQSKKARDGAVKEANKKYKESVAAADQEYYVTGTISKKKHDYLIAKAKSERDGAVKQAEDMNNKVVEQAKKQAKGHLDQIDWETGNTLSKWDNTKIGLSKTWNSITGAINKVLSFLHLPTIPEWHPTGSTGKNLPAHAAGTAYHPGGLALVGEEGPELAYIPYKGATLLGSKGAELRNLPQGTKVIPHAQTQQMLNGGLSGSLPGYAGGTMNAVKGFVSSVWNKTKDVASAAWGKVKSIGGDIKDVASAVAGWIAHPVAKTKALFNKYLPLSDDLGAGLGTGILKYVGTGVQKYLKDKFSSFGSNLSGAAAPAQVKQWLLSAMAITGTPAQYLGALTKVAMHESGGNPKAINLWDSNAKAGHPSKGLMQTIDSTFNAYKIASLGDIWNPVANAVAAIRYMNSRYGSISNVPGVKSAGYVGYKYGGRKFGNDPVLVGENGPEIVDPPDGSQINNNKKTQELLKGKGKIEINFSPVIQIKIDGNYNGSIESKIQKAVNAALERAFKDFRAIIDSGVAY